MGLFGKKRVDMELGAKLVEQGMNHILTRHNEGQQAFRALHPELTQTELDKAGLDGYILLSSIGAALSRAEPPVAVHIYNVPTGRNSLGNVIGLKTLASVLAVGDVDMKTAPPDAEREDVYVPQERVIEPVALGIIALGQNVPEGLDQAATSLRPDALNIALGISPLS